MDTLHEESSLSPWYVTGYSEGAGTFSYSRNRNQMVLVFAVRRSLEDRDLLEKLRAFFGGAGKIYASNACVYRVNRPVELLRVVEHFDRYPLPGSKRNTYRVWREMVHLRMAHHGSRTPIELQRLAERLTRSTGRMHPAS